MSTVIDTTNPEALETLLAEVAGLKEIFSNAHRAYNNRPTRGKYGAACIELRDNALPFIVLSRDKFNNESESSMQSMFKRTAEKMKLGFVPSLVTYEDDLLLCNFDDETAETKFNEYIMSKAGIDASTLAEITRDLDANTR
jgi:hypothetical protein